MMPSRVHKDFNPRSHEGSDSRCLRSRFPFLNFNPRSHEGSDITMELSAIAGSNFNPRSHEGSDRFSRAVGSPLPDFNPRSHEGSDHTPVSIFGDIQISIHAPTRGATNGRYIRGFITPISIHAPTRGATGDRKKDHAQRWNFNPRSHEGSDFSSADCTRAFAYFNPRSHEGSDASHLRVLINARISIHAPTRGATEYRAC